MSADDGLLRARQEAGPFIVSVFTAPEPLRVGPVEVTVLVQSSGGAVLTDADVDILLESATRPIERRRARATQDAASNKLAKAAVVDLPAAGQWTLNISVRVNGDAATVTCLLPVAPASSRMSLAWPWLLVPPVVVALFALHQRLKRQRGMGALARSHARRTHARPGMECHRLRLGVLPQAPARGCWRKRRNAGPRNDGGTPESRRSALGGARGHERQHPASCCRHNSFASLASHAGRARRVLRSSLQVVQ